MPKSIFEIRTIVRKMALVDFNPELIADILKDYAPTLHDQVFILFFMCYSGHLNTHRLLITKAIAENFEDQVNIDALFSKAPYSKEALSQVLDFRAFMSTRNAVDEIALQYALRDFMLEIFLPQN